MLFPVRCFTCGKPIGHLWKKYLELSKKVGPKEAFKRLKIKRYCCRRMFISGVEIMKDVIKYHKIEKPSAKFI